MNLRKTTPPNKKISIISKTRSMLYKNELKSLRRTMLLNRKISTTKHKRLMN